LLGENIGTGQVVGFFEAFVCDPGDVGAGFVAIEPPFVLFKPNPTLALFLMII